MTPSWEEQEAVWTDAESTQRTNLRFAAGGVNITIRPIWQLSLAQTSEKRTPDPGGDSFVQIN